MCCRGVRSKIELFVEMEFWFLECKYGIGRKSRDNVFIFALVFFNDNWAHKIHLEDVLLGGIWIIDTVNTKNVDHFQPTIISEM